MLHLKFSIKDGYFYTMVNSYPPKNIYNHRIFCLPQCFKIFAKAVPKYATQFSICLYAIATSQSTIGAILFACPGCLSNVLTVFHISINFLLPPYNSFKKHTS